MRRERTGAAVSVTKLFAALLALLLLAAACGSDSDDDAAADDGDDGSTDTTAAVADDDLDLDAVLRWAGPVDLITMDPHKQTSAAQNQFLYPVYDALTFLTVDGEVEPMLATSWEFEASPPSLTLSLREGLTFDSGTPFDAEAVKANLERVLDPDVSVVSGDLKGLESVEVVDETTVKLNLAEPLPEFPILLADRAGMMVDPAMFDSPELASNGAGIGPYDMVEYVQGAEINYARADDYWDPEAQKVAEIRIRVVKDDPARLNAVLSGEADFLELVPGQFDQARDADLEIISGLTLQTERMAFNTSKSEFGKIEVRQALNHAIDREAIVNAVLADICVPQVQFAPEGFIMHSDQVPDDMYAYDPDKARELLAEAGLEDGFSFETVVVNSPSYIKYAEIMQQYFRDIGVEMKLTPLDGADIINAFYADKQGDAIISGGIASGAPSNWAVLHYTANGFRNPGGNTTPELEELTQKVRTTEDPDELEAAWDELSFKALEYAFDIQICGRTKAYAAQPDVVGLEMYLTSQRQIRGVGVKA